LFGRDAVYDLEYVSTFQQYKLEAYDSHRNVIQVWSYQCVYECANVYGYLGVSW